MIVSENERTRYHSRELEQPVPQDLVIVPHVVGRLFAGNCRQVPVEQLVCFGMQARVVVFR